MSYVQHELNEVFNRDQIILSYLGMKHQGKTKQQAAQPSNTIAAAELTAEEEIEIKKPFGVILFNL